MAFKLAAALSGDQKAVLEEYADMVCLGTVADVMPLQGENRVFTARGLQMLAHTKRPGIAALMKETGCAPESITATSIGFMLAPRINAADGWVRWIWPWNCFSQKIRSRPGTGPAAVRSEPAAAEH